MTASPGEFGRDRYGNPPAVLTDWVKAEMARQKVVPYDSEVLEQRGFDLPTGYFCTASGCWEDQTDSNGECINCGEPVVYAMADPSATSGGPNSS